MLEFMQVPGFIVYRNRIVDTPHGADLTRDPIAEVEDECAAQATIAAPWRVNDLKEVR